MAEEAAVAVEKEGSSSRGSTEEMVEGEADVEVIAGGPWRQDSFKGGFGRFGRDLRKPVCFFVARDARVAPDPKEFRVPQFL